MRIGGICSREEAIQLFGELDVWRVERDGLEYYVAHTASPKHHYLHFGRALLQCYAQWGQIDKRNQFRHWLGTLPVWLRGALIWWLCIPHFISLVIKRQKQEGYWPFHLQEADISIVTKPPR